MQLLSLLGLVFRVGYYRARLNSSFPVIVNIKQVCHRMQLCDANILTGT